MVKRGEDKPKTCGTCRFWLNDDGGYYGRCRAVPLWGKTHRYDTSMFFEPKQEAE